MDDLAGLVATAFGLDATSMVRGNRGALGQIWQLRTPTMAYAVKELFTAAEPDRRLIAAEVAVTERAAAAGVRVPRSHPARTGDYAVRYGDRWIRVYDWLDLTPVDPASPRTADQLGALLADLHRTASASATEPDGTPPDPWFDSPPEPGTWSRRSADATAANVAWADSLARLVPRIVALTALAEPADVTATVTCHRDLHPENVLLSDGDLAVVDWDNLGPAVPGGELGKVVFDWYFAEDVLDEAAAGRMLAAYRERGGPGRLSGRADFGFLIAARLNFLDRQIGVALDPDALAEHRVWAVKEIEEALTILPSMQALDRVLQLAE